MIKKKIKLLFITDTTTWPYCTGGSETGINIILNELSKKYGFECTSIGAIPTKYFNNFNYLKKILNSLKIKHNKITLENVNFSPRDYDINILPLSIKKHPFSGMHFTNNYSTYIFSRNKLFKFIERYIIKEKPDIVVGQFLIPTQLFNIFKVYKLIEKEKIPGIIYIVNKAKHTKLIVKFIQRNKKIYMLYYSKFLMESVKSSKNNHLNSIFTPPVDKKKYLAKYNSKKFVTFINPAKQKGIEIFEKIINKMPKVNFLLVEGWQKKDFDRTKKRLKKHKNIFFLTKQLDMKNVYNKTKILLIPSVWEEGFGRVSIEAELNGIPVIASDIGGLNESVGKGGILIKDYKNIDEWVANINLLLNNNKKYKRLSQEATKYSKKYTDLRECKKLAMIITNLAANNK